MIVPTSRPQIIPAEANAILAPFYITDKVVLLGIRGYYKRTMGDATKNDRGIYDDAMFVIAPGVFVSFNANNDPSVFRKGISVLKPGVHPYRKGNHGISKPGGGYPALRPATPGEKLPVIRDGQGESQGIAINIHKGSLTTTSSAGCQTIYPKQWKEFQELVYSLMDKYKQKVVKYVLVEM